MSAIIIVADSLRHDALGCCGGPAKTPTADRLAGEATLFERTITACPWTVPSIASMLTGVYSHRLGLAKWEQPWPDAYPNLFELAAQADYEIASFVFDPTHLFRRVPAARVKGSSQDTDALMGWLKANRGKKFLLLVHYWWTHIPYVATPMTTRTWFTLTKRMLAAMRTGERARHNAKQLYYRAVEGFSEQWLPMILDVVDLDTTWLFITSDHGESWGERPETAELRDVFDLHGNTLYEEVLRVPLMIRPPQGQKPARITDLTRTVDLLATAAQLLGLPMPTADIDGVSLGDCVTQGASAPLMSAVSAASRDFVDAKAVPKDPKQLWRSLALTTGQYKQIWTPLTDSYLAFNLADDPGETLDISDAENPALSNGWQILRNELARARTDPLSAKDETALKDRLRQLGYID
ncbi:MAG: sulfatase-like hydrolase/transferase [Myxococcota bacterium]|nr:sulfatase-like hydrolase/transferase [Myxococcota bacterium]